MKASDMIARLQKIIEKHGDLSIVGGYLADDTPPESVSVIGHDGVEWAFSNSPEPQGIFISQ